MIIKSLTDILADPSPNNYLIKLKGMLGANEVPKLNKFIQATFPAGTKARNHKHDDMYEIFFINKGLGEVKINDDIIQFKADDCIVVEPNEFHEFRNTGSDDLVMTYFGVDARS